MIVPLLGHPEVQKSFKNNSIFIPITNIANIAKFLMELYVNFTKLDNIA